MRLPVQVAIVAALAAGSAFADDWTKTFVVSGQPELRIETEEEYDRMVAAVEELMDKGEDNLSVEESALLETLTGFRI